MVREIRKPGMENVPGFRSTLYAQRSTLGCCLVVWFVPRSRSRWLVGDRTRVRGLVESRTTTAAARMTSAPIAPHPTSATAAPTAGPASRPFATFGCTAVGRRATIIAPPVNTRSPLQHLFSTGGEHSFQRLDAIIGRFQKEVLHHGLGALELGDQHLRVRSARHLSAYLGHDTIAACPVQNHDHAPFSRLHEIRGLRHLMLRDPGRTPSPFPFCHGFGHLPERRSKEYTLSRVSRRVPHHDVAKYPSAPATALKSLRPLRRGRGGLRIRAPPVIRSVRRPRLCVEDDRVRVSLTPALLGGVAHDAESR